MRDAPWELDEEFLTKHKIDFVAHDELPYESENSNDLYAAIKAKGMFVATERTEGKKIFLTIPNKYLNLIPLPRCFHVRHSCPNSP